MTDATDPPDLEGLKRTATAAERTWRSFEATGGLVTLSDVAQRWGVELQTVRGYRKTRKDFPDPVTTIGRSDVWAAAALDLWRATPRQPGRPPKTP